MSRTISVANDVIRKLDKFKPVVSNGTGKDEPSYSDVMRFIMARADTTSKPPHLRV